MSEAAVRFMKAHIGDLQPGQSCTFDVARLRDAGFRDAESYLRYIGKRGPEYTAERDGASVIFRRNIKQETS
jgi:hypothetical protein